MKTTEKKPNRLYWLDTLRTTIIFLVVVYHVGGVYESTGLWMIHQQSVGWVL